MAKGDVELKYIAIKLSGYKSFIWFKKECVTDDLVTFTGKYGWGANGALVNIKCNSNEILSTIESDTLSY